MVEKVGDGALTYVSVGFERERLNITSYLDGQNYSREAKSEGIRLQDQRLEVCAVGSRSPGLSSR